MCLEDFARESTGGGTTSMNRTSLHTRLATHGFILFLSITAIAQTIPIPKGPARPATKWPIEDHTYVIKNFKFGTGETLPELSLQYLTLGQPHRNAAGHIDNAILLLHGTGGFAGNLLVPQFSDVLFGPGQPFDITKYFLIFPDDIGHGQSSRP